MSGDHFELDEEFEVDELNTEIWFPYYLPHWSSREESAATWFIRDGELHLLIPADQPLWCPGLHEEPLRVSGIQTGSFAGPVGSTTGQQPFEDGLTVREQQPTFWGYTPRYGRIAGRMRGALTPRSMFGFWLAGIEDRPERSGEILVAEVFGDAIEDGSAAVGMGIRSFRDPGLTGDFSTPRLEIDVSEPHTYAVVWNPAFVEIVVDDVPVRRIGQSPGYPMQLMIGVFDVPARDPSGIWADHVPELVVSSVKGAPLS
ncbi:MAG TPA: glycoside hydrolase family 16 protein [Acidimicrobiia bacterium]|nr:glycoside hydrolase family 16 protein [Acidimicrobiia bacterium]